MKKDLSLKVKGVNSSPKLKQSQTVISGFTEVNLTFELDFYFASSLSLNRT